MFGSSRCSGTRHLARRPCRPARRSASLPQHCTPAKRVFIPTGPFLAFVRPLPLVLSWRQRATRWTSSNRLTYIIGAFGCLYPAGCGAGGAGPGRLIKTAGPSRHRTILVFRQSALCRGDPNRAVSGRPTPTSPRASLPWPPAARRPPTADRRPARAECTLGGPRVERPLAGPARITRSPLDNNTPHTARGGGARRCNGRSRGGVTAGHGAAYRQVTGRRIGRSRGAVTAGHGAA